VAAGSGSSPALHGGRWARTAPPRGKNSPYKWARRPPAACSRMSRRACRPTPRQARVTGEERPTDRWAREGRGCRRLRRRHAGGNGFRGPRRAQHLGKELPTLGTGAGEPGRRGRGGAARRRRPENNSQCHCSDTKISKNLNRSAQSGE
jgi:hypothetical protein